MGDGPDRFSLFALCMHRPVASLHFPFKGTFPFPEEANMIPHPVHGFKPGARGRSYRKRIVRPPPAMWIAPPGATCAGRFADV